MKVQKKLRTGQVVWNPSSAVFTVGNFSPCQMFIRCSPRGISLLPHGNNLHQHASDI